MLGLPSGLIPNASAASSHPPGLHHGGHKGRQATLASYAKIHLPQGGSYIHTATIWRISWKQLQKMTWQVRTSAVRRRRRRFNYFWSFRSGQAFISPTLLSSTVAGRWRFTDTVQEGHGVASGVIRLLSFHPQLLATQRAPWEVARGASALSLERCVLLWERRAWNQCYRLIFSDRSLSNVQMNLGKETKCRRGNITQQTSDCLIRASLLLCKSPQLGRSAISWMKNNKSIYFSVITVRLHLDLKTR